MKFWQMAFDLVEMVFDKIRWNVMGIAVLITLLIQDFGDKLIAQLGLVEGIPPEAIIAVLALLIGTGIGGLIAALIRMFESPNVPADVFERVVKLLAKES